MQSTNELNNLTESLRFLYKSELMEPTKEETYIKLLKNWKEEAVKLIRVSNSANDIEVDIDKCPRRLDYRVIINIVELENSGLIVETPTTFLIIWHCLFLDEKTERYIYTPDVYLELRTKLFEWVEKKRNQATRREDKLTLYYVYAHKNSHMFATKHVRFLVPQSFDARLASSCIVL